MRQARHPHRSTGPQPRRRPAGRATSVLAGLAVLAAPASPGVAVTLGDLVVSSALGQPLRATIPVQLGPGEVLSPDCVQVTGTATRIGRLPPARLEISGAAGTGRIQLSTAAPLLEPLYELVLGVRCAGTAAVVREYVLMLDLPAMLPLAGNPEEPGEAAATTLPRAPVAGRGNNDRDNVGAAPMDQGAVADGQTPPATISVPDRPPLTAGIRYRVAAGDTLYSIARRAAPERPVWDVAGEILATNPSAFVRNDPNLIMLGAEIIIPGDRMPVSEPGLPAGLSTAVTTPAPPVPAVVPAVAEGAAVATTTPPTTETILAGPAPAVPPAATPMTTVAEGSELTSPVAGQALAPGPGAETTATVPGLSAVLTPRQTVSQPADVSPWAAALAGALFGLLVGGLLWLGRRLAGPLLAARPDRRNPGRLTAGSEQPARHHGIRTVTLPLAVSPRTLEGDITDGYAVQESVDDDPLAAEFAIPARDDDSGSHPRQADEITAELAELFDGDPTADMPAPVAAPSRRPAPPAPGRAHGGTAAADMATEVDFLLEDEDETRLAAAELTGEQTISATSRNRIPTEAEATSASGTLDLPALVAAGATGPAGETLREALSLLERDYEDEFTASTLLEPAAVRAALDHPAAGDAAPEPTQIHLRRRSG